MATLQSALLSTVSAHVKPGGRLVYAVCSTEERESTAVVDAFLAEGNFARVPAPDALAPYCDANGDLLTAPVDGRDGFFAAALERRR